MAIPISPLDADYRIAQRDQFLCTYCGRHRVETGALDIEDLVVVPIIRLESGGTGHDVNKTTACRSCAQKKGDRTFYPNVDYGSVDSDGWHAWKRFGQYWSIRCSPDGSTAAISHEPEGWWIDILDCWRGDEDGNNTSWCIFDHLDEKCWKFPWHDVAKHADHSNCRIRAHRSGCPVVDLGSFMDAMSLARATVKRPKWKVK